MKLAKLFTLFWKTLLVIAVYFVTFQSTNILIASWKKIIAIEQFQNIIHGDKFFVVGDAKLKLIVLDTEEKRVKGLSGMESLPDDKGMLFIFDKPDYYGIWMKDMNFSIDIIWFDEKFQVVDYISNVSPDTFPNVFRPKDEAKYVLEVNSGFIQKYGIKIDDQATFLD